MNEGTDTAAMTTSPRNKGIDSAHLLRFERNFLSGILETTNALIAVLDPQGRVLRLNRAIEQITGITILEAVGTVFWEMFLFQDDWPLMTDLFGGSPPTTLPFEAQTRLKARDESARHILWSGSASLSMDGTTDFIILTGVDITALKNAEQEKEKLIIDLQNALSKVKTLKGLLPMCANCQKIRDDQGYWQRVEKYISDHTEADFTHGICPECARKLYPQYTKDWYPDEGKS
jgi:PAS domain S-box-containing protein